VATLRQRLSVWAKAHEVELIFFDPPEHFDHAIVGLVYGNDQAIAVLYDETRVLAAMAASGMGDDDAREWFEFNTVGAFLGEATPRFLIKPWEVTDGEEA
jgi:hypothetical protein